jgi:hypothetical protein
LFEPVGIQVPIRNFRDFTVGSSHKSCPSARSASAANTICKDIGMFSKQVVKLNHILKSLCYGVSSLLLDLFSLRV